MAYNEQTAQRIRNIFYESDTMFSEKKMFSGVCFMVDDKMCCGTHIDKKTGEELLLCRIGEKAYYSAIEQNDCIPMEFTGKPMIGFVYVTETGFVNDKSLSNWLRLCLAYNPFAKKSKKK